MDHFPRMNATLPEIADRLLVVVQLSTIGLSRDANCRTQVIAAVVDYDHREERSYDLGYGAFRDGDSQHLEFAMDPWYARDWQSLIYRRSVGIPSRRANSSISVHSPMYSFAEASRETISLTTARLSRIFCWARALSPILSAAFARDGSKSPLAPDYLKRCHTLAAEIVRDDPKNSAAKDDLVVPQPTLCSRPHHGQAVRRSGGIV
jgi:hypothetical protein